MAKKKTNKNTGTIVSAAALLMGVLALCLAGFMAAVAFGEGENAYTATGFAAAFGWKQKVGSGSIAWSEFNFLIMLALFLPLIGGILAVVKGKLSGLSRSSRSLRGRCFCSFVRRFLKTRLPTPEKWA